MQRNESVAAPIERTQARTGQKGQALITVIGAFALVLLLLTAALTLTQYSGKITARQLAYQGQALNAAQAGLTDTLSWFRRQQDVVTTFDPKRNLSANPVVNDSEEPAEGIQRSFEMSDTFNLTGRYRVARQWTDSAGRKRGVVDVSVTKGKSGTGTVWELESSGCVIFGTYATSYGCTGTSDATPGRIIAREMVRAEIQRLNLVLPAGGAAIYARRADGVTISSLSKIQGGAGIGLAYPSSTGSYSNSGSVTGASAFAADSNTPPKIQIQDIFGVTPQEVLSMADINVASVSELPEEGMPQMNLIVIRGNATFPVGYPMSGSGILIVFGNLTVVADSNPSFSGVIYVTGNVEINAPAIVSGAIIAAGNGDKSTSGTGGKVTIKSVSDPAAIDFDQSIVDQIQAQMGNYRFSREHVHRGKRGEIAMRNAQRGMSLAEVLVGLMILSVMIMTTLTTTTTALKLTKNNVNKEFATQKAISMLEELRSLVQTSNGSTLTFLDAYDDGTQNKFILTTQGQKTNPVSTQPEDLISGTPLAERGGCTSAASRSSRYPGQGNDVRFVNVKVFINEDGKQRLLAEVASVLRTLVVDMPTTQVYDVYAVAVENVPGWWTFMSNIVPFVRSTISDMQARNPGLVFRDALDHHTFVRTRPAVSALRQRGQDLDRRHPLGLFLSRTDAYCRGRRRADRRRLLLFQRPVFGHDQHRRHHDKQL